MVGWEGGSFDAEDRGPLDGISVATFKRFGLGSPSAAFNRLHASPKGLRRLPPLDFCVAVDSAGVHKLVGDVGAALKATSDTGAVLKVNGRRAVLKVVGDVGSVLGFKAVGVVGVGAVLKIVGARAVHAMMLPF